MRKLASLVLALALGLTAVPFALSSSAAEGATPISPSELPDVLFGKEKMTYVADSAHQTGVSGWGESNEVPNQLFDGKTNDSKLGGNTTTGTDTVTITWTMESAVPAYFVIYTGGDTAQYGRNPTSIKLYGSDDSGEKLLVEAGSVLERVNNWPYGFAIDDAAAYTDYKLVLSTEGQLQLNELELYSAKDIDGRDHSGNPLKEGRYDLSGLITLFTTGGHSFLDGNLLFTLPIQSITGFMNTDALLDNSTLYINDVEAKFNKSYKGYQHAGLNGSNGYFYGIIGAAYTKNVDNKFLLQIGDDFYCETTFKPDHSAVAVVDSEVTYYQKDNLCIAKVTFAENQGYKVDDTVTAQLHDDHKDRTFKVTAVEGNTVTFKCTDFSSEKTLLEFNKTDDTHAADNSFSVAIDKAPISTTTSGHAQTRPSTDTTFDLRILAESHKDFLEKYTSAVITATFVDASGKTVTISSETATRAFATVIANGETIHASDDCGYIGVIVSDIPYGTQSVKASITFTGDSGSETKELGSLNLLTVASSIADVKKNGNAYNANDITVYKDGSYSEVINPDGENAGRLFDGKVDKMGGNDKTPVYFKTAAPITINGLIFTVANDTNSNGASRTFQNWALYGRNEAGEWVLVAKSDSPITTGVKNYNDDDYPDLEKMEDGNREAFSVFGAGEFDTYKLEFTPGSGYTQMGELSLYTKK